MKKQFRILLFLVVLFVNITGGLLKNRVIDYISKPLIVIFLIAWFLSATQKINSGLKKWILLALFFSLTGDVLLLFQQDDKIFFLLGLSAFLMAHIFYIVCFHHIRVKEKIKPNVLMLLIVVVYYALLITFLSPYLGDMKLPVRIYAIVISFMFMLAMHLLFIKNKITGQWLMTGALLFVISDSALAINKFYQSFETAPLIVILTYGLAQLFITEGAIRYITSADKE